MRWFSWALNIICWFIKCCWFTDRVFWRKNQLIPFLSLFPSCVAECRDNLVLSIFVFQVNFLNQAKNSFLLMFRKVKNTFYKIPTTNLRWYCSLANRSSATKINSRANSKENSLKPLSDLFLLWFKQTLWASLTNSFSSSTTWYFFFTKKRNWTKINYFSISAAKNLSSSSSRNNQNLSQGNYILGIIQKLFWYFNINKLFICYICTKFR